MKRFLIAVAVMTSGLANAATYVDTDNVDQLVADTIEQTLQATRMELQQSTRSNLEMLLDELYLVEQPIELATAEADSKKSEKGEE